MIEHGCFTKLRNKHGSTEPFERPVVIDKETLDFVSVAWCVQVPASERMYRINYCPFCGVDLRDDATGDNR